MTQLLQLVVVEVAGQLTIQLVEDSQAVQVAAVADIMLIILLVVHQLNQQAVAQQVTEMLAEVA